MRTKITLACTECKQRNYNMTKDKKTHPDRMETKKSVSYTHLPLYRQEKGFELLGVSISRTTMANWIITCSQNYLQPKMCIRDSI